MKFLKNCVYFLLILTLIINFIPADKAEAAENKPVWTVAWITIPQVRVHVGSVAQTVDFPDYRMTFFLKTASVFKNFIETHTKNAVEIKITFINVDIVPEFNSEYTDKIGFRARLTREIKEKYDIENYDTWIVGWPFHQFWELDSSNKWFMNETNKNWNYSDNGRLTSANLTYDSREIYLEAESSMGRYKFTSIHEFLHITEFWFRNTLHFELPYNIPDSENGPFALHNPGYFGYGEEYNVISRIDYTFFIDWLRCRIRDPRYPKKLKYLGVPVEAWKQSPTHITVRFEHNNGITRENTVHTRTILTTPNKPVRTKQTGDKVFRSWHYDENLTVLAHFPHDVTGDVTFYAKWGYASGCVPSSNPDAYIDLNNETLVLPSAFVNSMTNPNNPGNPAYSIDGEKKWKQGVITFEQFPKLLDKELTLVLTNNYDAQTKSPAKGASVITFEPIEKRPKTNAEKLRIKYSNDTWTLARNGRGNAVFENYQIAQSSSEKTSVTENLNWQYMPEKGVPILPYGSKTQFYFVRSAPVATADGKYIPASKPFRVSPLNQPKPNE